MKESWDYYEMKLDDILFFKAEMSFLRPSMKCFSVLLTVLRIILALGLTSFCMTCSSSLS